MVVSFQQYAENRDFFSNFSADGLHNWSILLFIPLEFQKSINRFLWHSLYFLKFQINPSTCYGMWLFYLHNMAKRQLFSFNFSVGGLSGWGILSVIPLELQEMQHQAFPYDAAQKMERLSHIFSKEKGLYNCWVMQNANHVPTAGFFERASLRKGISYGPVPPIPLWNVP